MLINAKKGERFPFFVLRIIVFELGKILTVMRIFFNFCLILFLFYRCGLLQKREQFILLDNAKTGLDFSNRLSENDSINGNTFEYIYNGGGLAVGDVNNDGHEDIFFAGNMVSSELYLNQGNLKFQNITEQSGVRTNQWCTGVSIVDINEDGLKDIYVCVAGYDTTNSTRENILFINQGIDDRGIPRFQDQAKQMGLNDVGYSTMGVFFDYDKDSDLDLFLLTNSMDGTMRNEIRDIKKDGTGASTDRLYRNEGNNSFVDVSHTAGIVFEGYGLGVGLCDINQDGEIDVYCSNDFISNDLLYINNGDGSFSEKSSEFFKHFSHNGMGMDIADFNNDALLDIMVLDMLPKDNKRQKLMIASNTMTFNESVESGYHPQFLRNTLQLNRGTFQDGKQRFSEISFLAGVYQTDWSWAPIFADFDNDGWKDLLITNGFRKDVTNQDYYKKISDISRFGTKEANELLIKKATEELDEVKLPNFLFFNNRDLTFCDKSEEWGLIQPTFTNGTAIADFDHDGDLDLVFNNLDQEVSFYKNTLNDLKRHHYLKLKFHPSITDAVKVGLKVWVFLQGNPQYIEYYPFRGYKSTLSEEIHFGLGKENIVDSVIVEWNDRTVNKLKQLQADTVILLTRNLNQSDNQLPQKGFKTDMHEIQFLDVTSKHHLNFKHHEVENTDVEISPTILRSLSHFGPSICVGDMNNDGFDDIFVGGDSRRSGQFFFQNENAAFSVERLHQDSIFHDMGSLLFDADNDGDLDLYVVSGGYKWPAGHENYQDRLYFNHGNKNYILEMDALPTITSSGSCVIAGDYDKDGDLDLFVGGRVEGSNYPLAPQSYLLQNENGKFVDRSDLLGVSNGRIGMVTSALFTDVNNDLKLDIIIAGEWMPITILINENGKFNNQTQKYELQNSSGWWNSINGADLDNDGDIDYVVGNYGLNSFYKASIEKLVEIYTKDFDHNGSHDPVITHFTEGNQYIIHPLTTMEKLIPGIRNRFKTHSEFGETTFQHSFTQQELKNAHHLTCRTMETIVLENVNGTSFEMHPLPMDVQFSPVFGSLIEDVNADGWKDILLVGNSMNEETIFGYYDASYGNVLINRGNFNWNSLEPSSSNFIADGDKRAFAQIKSANGNKVLIISENSGQILCYAYPTLSELNSLILRQDDCYVFYNSNGRQVKEELYHGHGYLSSSSRIAAIPKAVKKVMVHSSNGDIRTIHFPKKN